MTTEIARLAPHDLVKTPEVISLRREARAIRDAIELATILIRSVEERTKKRGGPTSQMGRTLFKLKSHCTALHMALAAVRNKLRVVFASDKTPVLHCEQLRTPDGIALVDVKLQEIIGSLIHMWIVDGQDPEMFGVVSNIHHRIIREAAQAQIKAAVMAMLPESTIVPQVTETTEVTDV